MKLFVIDGNNVYHAISAVRGAADQRRAFMDYLSGTNYFSAKKKATVVFDGSADESHTAGSVPFIKVIYSDQKKADDVIRKIVERESKKNRDRLVVISDDREVLLVAKESRVATMRNPEHEYTGNIQAKFYPESSAASSRCSRSALPRLSSTRRRRFSPICLVGTPRRPSLAPRTPARNQEAR